MFLNFLNCAILSLSLSFLTTPSVDKAVTPPQKVVEWLTPQEHDFGSIRRFNPVAFVFEFKNRTNDTITLQTVRTTCGCTAADWTETPIAPGETGAVRIEYDAYQTGDFNKKIRVFFDKQRKPDFLKIRGSVE